MALTALTSAAEVLVAAEHDPYVRGRLKRPEVEGWAAEGAVAWRFRYSSDRAPYLMTHGEPANVALLLEALLPELRDGQEVTVPRGTAALLPAWVGLDGTEWDFRWTYEAPPRQPTEAEVRPAEDDDVRPLLEVANPDASARPGDPRVRGWLGMFHPHGHALACAADTSEATAVGHVSSIAVHPSYRGHGLGSAVTAALVRQLFDQGCDVVTLGMYADNTAGRALYDRLGMHERGFTSGTLRIRSRW